MQSACGPGHSTMQPACRPGYSKMQTACRLCHSKMQSACGPCHITMQSTCGPCHSTMQSACRLCHSTMQTACRLCYSTMQTAYRDIVRIYEVELFVTHLCPKTGDNPNARPLPSRNIRARGGNQTRNSIFFRLWAQRHRLLMLRPWKLFKSKCCTFLCQHLIQSTFEQEWSALTLQIRSLPWCFPCILLNIHIKYKMGVSDRNQQRTVLQLRGWAGPTTPSRKKPAC
jgi:hypothetical protein